MLKGKHKTRIFIFAVVFDIVLGVEHICEDDFYLIRIEFFSQLVFPGNLIKLDAC